MSTNQGKILVTGGSGFIGTHLCTALIKAGHSVQVLDLKKPANPVPGVNYILGDVRDPKAVSSRLDGVSAVYHLAALVSVPLCQEQPKESYETNLLATVSLLQELAKRKSQGQSIRLIFSSSASVYGNVGKKGVALKETDPLDPPLSLYAAQKLGCEHAIQIFSQSQGVPGFVFRFFNVYGQGQDPLSPYSGVISIFAEKLKQGQSLTIFGKGDRTRDFISVQDVARACVKVLELPDSKCVGAPVNLGIGKPVSILEFAQEMVSVFKNKMGKAGAIEFALERFGDVVHSCADISKARELLGWKPEVQLREGMTELFK